MRATVRVYLRLVAAGFRRQSAYPLAALGGLVANTTFGFLKVAVLFATVRAAGGEVRGYDLATMGAYIWWGQALLGAVNLYGRSDLAERIKDGQVAIDFLRPVSVQGAAIASEVGQALFSLLPRGVPILVIGAVSVPLAVPTSATSAVLAALSVLIGVVLAASTVYLIAVAGFWIVETRGLQVLYMVASGFLAGLFVPVSLFPDWLRLLATGTPFPSMLMTPLDILAGRHDATAAAGLVAVQLAWLALILGIGALLTTAGRRRLEVQGG